MIRLATVAIVEMVVGAAMCMSVEVAVSMGIAIEMEVYSSCQGREVVGGGQNYFAPKYVASQSLHLAPGSGANNP